MENKKEWKMSNLIKIVLGVMALGLFALGALAFAPGIVQAQDEEPAEPGRPLFGFHGFGGPRGFRFGGELDYDAFLADALGVTVTELQAAREAANSAMLEEALARGYITEEQVELMEARKALMQHIDKEALLTGALGISVDQLQAAREEGVPIHTLIEELGLAPDDVRDNLQAAHEEAVQQAVNDGVITQEQADQLRNGGCGMDKFGGRGGSDGHRGGFPGRGWFDFPKNPPPAESDNGL